MSELRIEEYTPQHGKTGYVVRGDSRQIKDQLKTLGCFFNKNFGGQPGWFFRGNEMMTSIKDLITEHKNKKPIVVDRDSIKVSESYKKFKSKPSDLPLRQSEANSLLLHVEEYLCQLGSIDRMKFSQKVIEIVTRLEEKKLEKEIVNDSESEDDSEDESEDDSEDEEN
jgi:hypothetical protein